MGAEHVSSSPVESDLWYRIILQALGVSWQEISHYLPLIRIGFLMTGETPEKDPLPSDLKKEKKTKKGTPLTPRDPAKKNEENSEGGNPLGPPQKKKEKRGRPT